MLNVVCLLLASGTASASSVAPVFAGFWYADARYGDIDSCGKLLCTYKKKATSPSPFINEFINSYPPDEPTCTWGDAYRINVRVDYCINYLKPLDFVYRDSDWSNICKNSSLPHTRFWQRDCTNYSTGVIEHSLWLLVTPSYKCPKKSGYKATNPQYGQGSCVNPPPPCSTDIVGRNLDIPVIGKLGHVGLIEGTFGTSKGIRVLEVLNKDPETEGVVQENSLDSFKKATKYWGERYGLKNRPYITTDEAKNIIHAGVAEKKCKPHYSYSWEDIPCGTPGAQPKFRCDSFVYYSYLKGANVQITDGTHVNIPHTIFYDRFINWRYNPVSDLLGIMSTNEFNGYAFEKIELNANFYEQEAKIQEIFNRKLLDLEEADQATKTYVKDDMIPRSKKLSFLWKLALKHQNNKYKFNYIASLLGYLDPIELSNQLIDLFSKQKIFENKIQILGMMVDSSAAAYKPTLLTEYNENIPKIRQFFRDMLFKSKNITLFREALLDYSKVADPKVAYYDIKKALKRPDMKELIAKDGFLRSSYFFYSKIQLILSDKYLQSTALPKLFSNMRNKKTEIRYRFNETLLTILEDYDGRNINISGRNNLLRYLLSNKPMLNLTSIMNWKKTIYCYTWLKAYASVKASTKHEKVKVIIGYILNTNDVMYKSILISYADQSVLKQATNKELLNMAVAISPKKMSKSVLLTTNRNNPDVNLIYQQAEASYFKSAISRLKKAFREKNKNDNAKAMLDYILSTNAIAHKRILIYFVDDTVLEQATKQELWKLYKSVVLKKVNTPLLMSNRNDQNGDLIYQRARYLYFFRMVQAKLMAAIELEK